jgi:hypothetical protein
VIRFLRLVPAAVLCLSLVACGDDEGTATAIKVEPALATTTAGTSLSVKVTVLAADGTPAGGFTGTVKLTSSDAQAVLPADLVFAETDNGVKQVNVTLKTAGLSTLTAADVASSTLRGNASVNVGPGPAASCVVGQAPTAARAGAIVGVAVTLHDAFNNVATTYTGTMRMTSSDPGATLPENVTFVAGDAGRHAFSAALRTAGAQTLVAQDVANAAIRCEAQIAIGSGAAKIVLTIPGDANAGFAVNVGVAVTDDFNNPVTDYVGTVTFASTDGGTGAVTPASITFDGTQGGVATTSAAFVTLGAQTLTATDGETPAASGSAAVSVHGLVYTAPTSGKVRLVLNQAQSNTQVVQLDLVANERIEVSSFFGGGPGPHSAGMNLPLDTNRAVADTTLFTSGNAFLLQPPGNPAPPPIQPIGIGRIGEGDHVLYTAVSRRRVAGTVFTQLNEVLPGRVFFSIRLRLTPTGTVGPVFDGAQSPLFRAAVRDQYGDDFVATSQFGIGKLEIR